MTVAVIGAGAWGTTVASLLAVRAETRLWAREPDVVDAVHAASENSVFLPGFRLPRELGVTNDLDATLARADVVVVAVPSQHLRTVMTAARPSIPARTSILSLTKGIEPDSCQRMTEVLTEVLPDHDTDAIGVLSGPNLAREVMAGQPAATCVAFPASDRAEEIQRLLMSDTLRVYTSRDVIGCEIGGAVKNVIAIAAGVADGLGYGTNTMAALITRGLAEMSRLGVALGGLPLTFLGLAGNGDLIATCSSPQSRNHRVGRELAGGRPLAEILGATSSVAEGVATAPAVLALAARTGVEMPISETVAALLAGQLTAAQVVTKLMRREPKAELHGLA